MEKAMWQGMLEDNITWLGDIARNAKLKLLANSGSSEIVKYYFEIYHMLGDATLDLYTDYAFEMAITHPDVIVIGTNHITVQALIGGNPVEKALVSIQGKSSGVQQIAYTDSRGVATLQLNPEPSTPEKLEVTVTSHNGKRYTGSIQTIAPNSPYLTYVSHKITSDGSHLIPPSPGIHIKMPITLKNIGAKPAKGILVNISTDSPDVTISQQNPSFQDLNAGTSAASIIHVEFDIHEFAKEQTTIPFKLEWRTEDGTSAFNTFTVTVQRPKLIYLSHSVDDSNGGCDQDGIPDANEPTKFSVVIKNIGNMDASDVEVDLMAPNCTVGNNATIGNIPKGGTATAHFLVTPQSSVDCPSLHHPFTAEIICDELPASDIALFEVLLNSDLVTEIYEDDMEQTEPNGWSHFAAIGIDDWSYVTTKAHSSSHSWFGSDVSGVKDTYLNLVPLQLGGESSHLSFWHHYGFEPGYDGGVIEISVDGGNTFVDLNDHITANGYIAFIDTFYESPIGGQMAWTGEASWQKVEIDLSKFKNQEVMIRFRLACDNSYGDMGWWIDDVKLITQTNGCQAVPCL